MIKPPTADAMNQFAINPMVNKVGVDQPECVQPFEPTTLPLEQRELSPAIRGALELERAAKT